MGYPKIAKFDKEFASRTLANVENFEHTNSFTHLINSLIGLIIIPRQFNLTKARKYKVDFLKINIADCPEICALFDGEEELIDEAGTKYKQPKFFFKDKNGARTINDTNVGELVSLFRHGIAHSNITPVSDDSGVHWKGIIVKNYKNQSDEKNGDYNFQTFLDQDGLRHFATYIAKQYVANAII